ncbi:MAG: 4Fe-4S binding protein [Pseudomonadota bacterium]
MSKSLILCDCEGSIDYDPVTLEAKTGLQCSAIHSGLCTRQIEKLDGLLSDGDAMIACGQEQSRLAEAAEAFGHIVPTFVDLRDRAGWSDEAADAGPKMAALLAEAQLPAPSIKARDVVSEGVCLIIGDGDVARKAAEKLCETLAVTLVSPPGTEPVLDARFDTICGRVKRVTGALGGFEVTLDAVQTLSPGGRVPAWEAPRDGGQSACDIVLDLSGGTAFVPAPEKREGYLKADPRHAPSVADAVLQAAQLIGTFEKPLYVTLTEAMCAHSRAGKPACSNCLDLCPTSAITSAGEHVAIDPMVCAGCGACASACPSGAISYSAPESDHVFLRLRTMAEAYAGAGGTAPRLLVHDDVHGIEMIALLARHGRGLPADVIPLALPALNAFGHAEMLAALGCGFVDVLVLAAPKTDLAALETQVALASALGGGEAVRLLDIQDPDMLGEALRAEMHPAPLAAPVLTMGTRRQVARLSSKALNEADAVLELPEGAPYGAVLVDTDACTLCLACASLCPSGALGDNPEKPQLRFQEDACLQCGLCANVCPENAITLEPQMNLADSAMHQQVLHEEEPYPCVSCGKPFGVRSTVERIAAQLEGQHGMFATTSAAQMIRMCEDCRVEAHFNTQNNPLAAEPRRKVRTTDDYFSDRRDH